MGTEPSIRRPDEVIANLACRQAGVVSRTQLFSAGLTPTMIGSRIRRGLLHPIHRGVYLVGHEVPPPNAREMAALLACGLGAAVSNRSAGAIWNLHPYPAPLPVHVTVPPERRVRRPGLVVHHAAINPGDLRRRHCLTLHSPPRTILDLATEHDLETLESVVAEARYRGLASEGELKAQLERYPARPGVRNLRAVLDLPGGPQRTRSRPERLMLRLLRHAGITGYEMNARILGYEVDVLWRQLDLAVEIDGYDGHGGRTAFERDRLKIATLKAQGLSVMPVTPRQLRDDPAAALGRLLRALHDAGYQR